MIRFLLKHDKLLDRMFAFAMYASPLPGLIFFVTKHWLKVQDADPPFIGILILQSFIFAGTILRWFVVLAYQHGYCAGLEYLSHFQNCRIQEIPGMKRPIFVRPDDPGAKS